jgi:rare lipoprotein A
LLFYRIVSVHSLLRRSTVVLSFLVAVGAAGVDVVASAEQSRRRGIDDWTRGPRGFATYYAKMLDGYRTASGTTFDNDHMVAAHPTYPFGTLVRVTNLQNGRIVIVRVVDRGPARASRAKGNIIDLSRAAAQKLGFIEAGRARVRLEFREPDEPDDDGVITSADGRRTEAEADR